MKVFRNRFALLTIFALSAGVFATTYSVPSYAQAKKVTPLTKMKAVKAYKDAQKKFKDKDYTGAAADYRKADGLLPGAKPKYKIGESLDLAGKTTDAIAAYQAFLDSKPAEKYAKLVEAATKRIDALKATLPGKVNVNVTPKDVKANVTTGGKTTACEGTCTLELKAGEHEIAVAAEGYDSKTSKVTVKGDASQELAVALEKTKPVEKAPEPVAPVAAPPAEPAATEVEEATATRSKIPAYVTLGVAGVGVALGTVFGVQALGAKSDFEEDPTVDNADKAERSALIADMSFGVALTFGITGTVLLFSNDDGDDDSALAPKLTPYAGRKGGGMAATWTF